MPNTCLSLFSPAKINLFLHITGKRADGYHNLQTVFRLLDWGDQLDFALTSHTFNPHQAIDDDNLPLTLDSNVAVTDNLADNLITKAAIALLEHIKANAHQVGTLPDTLPVIAVKLNKQIPAGAGLGGGSSNAATTLIALNQLWGSHLEDRSFNEAVEIVDLIKIGATVGADVPIFIFGQDAIAEGIGEQLTAIDLPYQHFLLLHPDAHASTQGLFQHPSLRRDMPSIATADIAASQADYLDGLQLPYCNVFEPVVTDLVPQIADALHYLKQLQPVTGSSARMTGTGSCVYLPIPADKLEAVRQHVIYTSPPPCGYVFTQSLSG